MSLVILFDERQNFRLRPRSSFVPSGNFCCLHRLWNVRFLGCSHVCEGTVCRAVLKFLLIELSGFEQSPKFCRQYCLVRLMRPRPMLVRWLLPDFFLIRRCFLLWLIRLDLVLCIVCVECFFFVSSNCWKDSIVYGMGFSCLMKLGCGQRDEKGLRFVFDLGRDWQLIAGFVGLESPLCTGCHFEVGKGFGHRRGELRAEVAAVAGTTEVWGKQPVLKKGLWECVVWRTKTPGNAGETVELSRRFSSEWIFSFELVVSS